MAENASLNQPASQLFCLFHCLMAREILLEVISGHVRSLGQSVTEAYRINIGAARPDAVAARGALS